MWRSEGKCSRILNFGSRWRWCQLHAPVAIFYEKKLSVLVEEKDLWETDFVCTFQRRENPLSKPVIKSRFLVVQTLFSFLVVQTVFSSLIQLKKSLVFIISVWKLRFICKYHNHFQSREKLLNTFQTVLWCMVVTMTPPAFCTDA